MGNPLLFVETDFTVGFADPMFPIRFATILEIRLQEMGDFYEKPHFTMENFKFREAVKWGLKIFAPNYQKAHPYAKSGRTNRLAYVAVTLLVTLNGDEKKSTRESPLENRVVYNTTSLPRRHDDGHFAYCDLVRCVHDRMKTPLASHTLLFEPR